MKRLFSLLSCAIGIVLLYLSWSLSLYESSPGTSASEVNGFTGILANVLGTFLLFYLIMFLAIVVAIVGAGLVIAGITGLLNSTAMGTPDSAIVASRLARLATIRSWISRAAWVPIVGGAGYFGVQLIRENLGADHKFADYFFDGAFWVMLGLLVLLVSAIGGLVARIVIKRL